MGAEICGVDTCVSESADGECEFSDVGDCLRDCCATCWCGGCGGVGAFGGVPARAREGECEERVVEV